MQKKNSNTGLVIALCATMLIVYNWLKIELFFNPVNTETLTQEDVVLYATSWCTYCTKTRHFLQSANIPYIEWDIEKSPRAHQQYLQINGRGVPLIHIGPTIVHGYNPQAIRKAIDTLVSSRQ